MSLIDKKIHGNEKGITLAELLVSLILIGIVMMGVVSFNYAIVNIQNSAGVSSALNLQLSGIKNQITKFASLATGNSADPGIRDPNDPYPKCPGTVCFAFRQDTDDKYVAKTAGGYGYTTFRDPTDPIEPPTATFSDDIWIKFAYIPEEHKLEYCRSERNKISPSSSFDGDCRSLSLRILSTQIKTFSFDLVKPTQAKPYDFYIEVKVTLQEDPDGPDNPVTNPKISSTFRVRPISHTWDDVTP